MAYNNAAGSSANILIDKAVQHANFAVRSDRQACDSNGDPKLYQEALDNYKKAMQSFNDAAKFERNPSTKAILEEKINEYYHRALVVRKWLDDHQQPHQHHQHHNSAHPRKAPGPRGADGNPDANPAGGSNCHDHNSTAAPLKGGQGPKCASNPSKNQPTPAPEAGHADSTPSNKNTDDSTMDELEDISAERAAVRKALAGVIVAEKPNVKWDDVAGLTAAKDALKEAAILPIKFPQMFVGERKPWKGILLYGPPGTGKSFLAKAVATEADKFFFSVSSSDLVSKWQGESEKYVKELFAMAREKKSAIIFIDEIDALVSARSESDSESSRRIKTEFLVQMDGVGNNTDGILVLGATNIPWGLDEALLRRMERRIYIPLPDRSARARMIKLHLGKTPHDLSLADFDALAVMSEGYSGSDLKVVVRDAIMQPVRMATQATHFRRMVVDGSEKLCPCSPVETGAEEMGLMEVPSELLHLPVVTRAHLERALQSSKPSVGLESLEKHEQFTREKGQEGC